MRDALTALGVDPARIHRELFGVLDAINPGLTAQHRPPPHQPPGAPGALGALGPPGTGPQVTFARSGITTAFGDAWRSVLDLADACDVPTRWSCRTGVCHTCVTPLLSGDISYAPDPLELPADGQILICCARPRTDLVLDM
ncbi:MAG TPA: 2Fe-2S iron-sulfur cluster-binding protein [Streptosporangiaceae bacterium]